MLNAETITKQLIEINSVSGNEAQLVNFILNIIRKIGFEATKVKNSGLVLKISGEDNTKMILFNAHLDTVTEGEVEHWKFAPYGKGKLTIQDKKIYGLGASDMKASVAALILLIEKLKITKPKIDVWFSFVINEEIDGSGTKEFIRWVKKGKLFSKYKNKSAIVCEPTGLSKIDLGHKGNSFIELITNGDSGHGSRPEKIKTNAIIIATKIIENIEKNKARILKKYKHPIMGLPTIGVTYITAGNAKTPNKFSDTCTIGIDFRFVPTFNISPKKLFKEVIGKIDYEYKEVSAFDLRNAIFTDRKASISKAVSKASGVQKFSIKKGATDMATLSKNGISGCIFGPGEENVIHKPDEYCYVDKVNKAVDIYAKTINLL